MIISISGNLGSGKSTVGKNLAKKLKFKHYSTGDFWRELAAKRGLDVYEYNKLAETDKTIDQEIDGYSAQLGQREDNFVIDSRLAWHFIPNSFKVKLLVDAEEGARRIFEQSQNTERGSEKKHESIEETIQVNKKREGSEKQRYIETYNADLTKLDNFDLVVDTTSITPEQVVKKILASLPKNK
jgi:CMP/dCMP kinase